MIFNKKSGEKGLSEMVDFALGFPALFEKYIYVLKKQFIV